MELHSYAKRRLLQKWTVEQKRRLVETRISNDYIFNNRTHNIQESWQKVVTLGNLEGFSVLFVRKQWTNMLARYKNLLSRYTVDNFVDKETADMLANEWEFFPPIHYYMLKKVTSLHSYAQCPIEEDEPEYQTLEEIPPVSITDDHAEVIVPLEETSHRLDDSIAMTVAIDTNRNQVNPTESMIKTEIIDLVDDIEPVLDPAPIKKVAAADTTPKPSSSSSKTSVFGGGRSEKLPKLKRLSYKDRYYRHCIRFNKRMERKLDSLLYVFGQVVSKEYPDVDATGLFNSYDDNQGDSSSSD